MSEPNEESPPVFQENHTSAAIDATRINCVTALILVDLDATLSDAQRDILSNALLQARQILDMARFTALPPNETAATSIHVVERGRLIVPR